jgi:hypothetical protein
MFSGGCTGVFIFGYCIYCTCCISSLGRRCVRLTDGVVADFKFKAKMSGFMQTSFFFGYMSMVSCLRLLCIRPACRESHAPIPARDRCDEAGAVV